MLVSWSICAKKKMIFNYLQPYTINLEEKYYEFLKSMEFLDLTKTT